MEGEDIVIKDDGYRPPWDREEPQVFDRYGYEPDEEIVSYAWATRPEPMDRVEGFLLRISLFLDTAALHRRKLVSRIRSRRSR
jgi:hypothetical protein